jgi:outer membrane protein OmpA-like peptidoglycan-associated protein
MGDDLPDGYLDWAHAFTGVGPLAGDAPQDPSTANLDPGPAQATDSISGSSPLPTETGAPYSPKPKPFPPPGPLPPTANTVFFDRNSDTLEPETKNTLDSFAAAFLSAGISKLIHVIGRASIDEIDFSASRAQNVADDLVTKSVPSELLKVVGLGQPESPSPDPRRDRCVVLSL